MKHGAANGKMPVDETQAARWRDRGEFDESAVLDAAVLCFWKQGYEATSVRDLVEHTGIAAASLYNAFGDKRALYEKALDHYVEDSIADRIRRCKSLPPLRAIEAFFKEIVKRSLDDRGEERMHAC